MNGKLVGAAVGAVLENSEAIKNVSAPTVNAAGGALQVIFGTIWKSIAISAALMVVWFVTYIFTYVLAGTNVVGSPKVMFLLGAFNFLILPAIVLAREVFRVSKGVRVKNAVQKEQARVEREAKEAEYAKAIEAWNIQQQQAAQDNQQQAAPATMAMPQVPQYN